MPLLDHFHPPLSERRPWGSFHATWCSTLADHLNERILPSGYIALEQVNPGAVDEIDDLFAGDRAQVCSVAYRPLSGEGDDRVETWTWALALKEPLPTVPLSLAADCCVAVDLEAAYRDACQRRRVTEALG